MRRLKTLVCSLVMIGWAIHDSAFGMTVIAEQNATSRLATVQIVIRAGSISDPSSLPGLAHFTARALLRGTRTRPYQELNALLERLGGTLEVGVDQGCTVLRGTVLFTNIDAYLDLLRDILTQPAFDVREIGLLQLIVAGELRVALQNPETLASRAVLKGMYRQTPLENPSTGTIDGVSRITPRDLESFHRAYYGSENMVIGAVSPLNSEEMRNRILNHLNTLPPGNGLFPRLPASTLSQPKALIVDRRGMATVPVFIAVPGVGESDQDLWELEMGNFIFGGDFNSRLMQVLRVQNGWTYGAFSGFDQVLAPHMDPGLFSIRLAPSVSFASLAIPRAVALLEEYIHEGLTAAEFTQARESLGNGADFLQDTAQKRLDLRLREALQGRPWLDPPHYREMMAGFDLASLNRVIRQRTALSSILLVAVGDAEALRPVLGALPLLQGVPNAVEVIDILP